MKLKHFACVIDKRLPKWGERNQFDSPEAALKRYHMRACVLNGLGWKAKRNESLDNKNKLLWHVQGRDYAVKQKLSPFYKHPCLHIVSHRIITIKLEQQYLINLIFYAVHFVVHAIWGNVNLWKSSVSFARDEKFFFASVGYNRGLNFSRIMM